MVDQIIPTCDHFLNDSIMRRINYRVGRLGRKYCLPTEDRQDIRQEFCMAMARASRRYDPAKCELKRFIRMVLNGNYKHWVRKLARADEKRARSVDALHFDDVEPDMEYYVPDPKGKEDIRLTDIKVDVREVLESLPEEYRDLCIELISDSPFEVARRRGVHHSAIYRTIVKIRVYFLRAGFEGIF